MLGHRETSHSIRNTALKICVLKTVLLRQSASGAQESCRMLLAFGHHVLRQWVQLFPGPLSVCADGVTIVQEVPVRTACVRHRRAAGSCCGWIGSGETLCVCSVQQPGTVSGDCAALGPVTPVSAAPRSLMLYSTVLVVWGLVGWLGFVCVVCFCFFFCLVVGCFCFFCLVG